MHANTTLMALRIKEIIREKGMTIESLADKMGVTRQALGRQVNGKMLVDTAIRIADTLEVPVSSLFEDSKILSSKENVCPHCGKPIHIILSVEK